jgi:PhnB protein
MRPTLRPKLAPYLVVRDAPGLVGFLERALGGRVTYAEKDDDGGVHHAEMRIADSLMMRADVPPGRDPFPAVLHLYVPDVDAVYKKALKTGAVKRSPACEPAQRQQAGFATPVETSGGSRPSEGNRDHWTRTQLCGNSTRRGFCPITGLTLR